jgi:hypothetical protein
MNIRQGLIVAGAFLLTFVAGAVSMHGVREIGDRSVSQGALPQSFDALALDSAQQAQLAAIFEAYQPRTDAVLADLIPRLAALADSMEAEILPILDPAQSETLKRMQRPAMYIIKRKSGSGILTDTLRTR